MRHGLIVAIVTLFVLSASSGCSSGSEGDGPAGQGAATEAEQRTSPRPDELFDHEGNLLESDVVVAGLRLPRGLEETFAGDRNHVYESRVPIQKIQAYFGPRLVTGQVDRMGDGAVFRAAAPRDARGAIVRMDVSILPMGRDKTRVEVAELPPAPENPPPEAESALRIEEALRQLD